MRWIGRRREAVEAEEYSQQMVECGHGMYYMPPIFFQYPSQMYQYPFEGHHIDTSAIRLVVLRNHILIFHGRL